MGSDLFDINAKPEIPAKSDQLMPMLQSLLAERFQLVIRPETKEVPGYALVVAKNGPKFQKASEPNQPSIVKVRRGLLVAPRGDMEIVANLLSSILGRPVVDKTGLTESYDLKLEWQPDDLSEKRFMGNL